MSVRIWRRMKERRVGEVVSGRRGKRVCRSLKDVKRGKYVDYYIEVNGTSMDSVNERWTVLTR